MTAAFDDAWQIADSVPGWLTQRQGQALWDAASQLSVGDLAVEIGSHQGRSTVVLARAAHRVGARVVAIDPFVEGRLFGGAETRARFQATIDRAGLADTVQLVAEPSTQVRGSWHEQVALLYIDGKHDYWSATNDLRWVAFLPRDATVLMHDAFSSIGVTSALLRSVLPGRTLRYAGRVGSLARFTVRMPTARDRLRIVCELPWFLRNVLIKIVLRMLRLAGRHRNDPY